MPIIRAYGQKEKAMIEVNKVGLTPTERATLDNAAAGAVTNGLSIEDLMNAIVELGELFAEQDDALVELAELIGE